VAQEKLHKLDAARANGGVQCAPTYKVDLERRGIWALWFFCTSDGLWILGDGGGGPPERTQLGSAPASMSAVAAGVYPPAHACMMAVHLQVVGSGAGMRSALEARCLKARRDGSFQGKQ
jgi:hypothetical protein